MVSSPTVLVMSLDQPAVRLPRVGGGKGAALARMRAAGLPVPPGYVVTAEAFRLSTPTLPQELERQLAVADPLDVESLEPLCLAAREAIVKAGVPDALASAVALAQESLGADIAMSVRSSATAEDQPWASFAGQYDTVLNAIGHARLLDALLQVWASIYTTRSVAYRLRLGIPHGSVGMAVVFQEQLAPRAAGVLFTVDPITMEKGRYLVNAALGLGEGVVSGQVPTDTFALDSVTHQVLTREVSTKGAMLVPGASGGTATVGVDEGQRDKPALDDASLSELGRLADQLVKLFNTYQDIEFALTDRGIQLLQSRPVTALRHDLPFPIVWDSPDDRAHRWVRGQRPTDQGAIFRLQEDVLSAYAKGSQACFEVTGAPMARYHLVRFFNGYSYSRPPDVEETEVVQRQQAYRDLERSYKGRGASVYDSEIRPEVERTLEELERFRPGGASPQALYAHLERTLQAYGRVMGDLHWRMALVSRNDWPRTYSRITGEPEVASGALLQAIPNRTTHLVAWLRDLARLVQSDSAIHSAFRARAYDSLQQAPLRDNANVQRLRARFRNLLRQYGHRSGRGFGSGTDFDSPTWNLDHRLPLDLIAAYAEQDLDALKTMEAVARRARRKEERRVRRLLSGDQERLQEFDRELSVAIEDVNRMENHNHIMEQGVHGALREAIHRMGEGMVKAHLLDNPDDVLHLSVDEIRDAAIGNAPADLRTVVHERAAQKTERSRLMAPRSIGEGPPHPPDQVPAFMEPPKQTGIDGLTLRGVGASPGMATGRARVAAMSAVPPRVERGDILVAINAGPAWTPIFPLLAGIVLDAGAVFQHAALVAREYGIPAVIMTRDATTVIVDGQMLVVDADLGTVELMP